MFYEDAYTNAPGDVVGKRSTGTTLKVSASGGDTGGMLYVSGTNLDKLRRTGGSGPTLPYSAYIPRHGGASLTIQYEAEDHSASENDITVTASIASAEDSASVTAVKVELQAMCDYVSPKTRHIYGIQEEVDCISEPPLSDLQWSGGGYVTNMHNRNILICDWHAYNGDVTVNWRGEGFNIPITVVEPSAIRCSDVAVAVDQVANGVAGGIGMTLELYVLPMNVSFSNIALMEVPTYDGYHYGYFDNLQFEAAWDHTPANHAGEWHNVLPGNRWDIWDNPMFHAYSSQGAVVAPPPWTFGIIVWNIPIAWGERNGGSGEDPIGVMGIRYNQFFQIYDDGTVRVDKFGHTASRATNGVVRLNGAIVQ